MLPSPEALADADPDAEALAEPDALLSDPGLAPAVPAELPLAGAFVALCVGEELADSDGLASGCGVGLVEAVLLGVVCGLALGLGLDDSQLVVLGWAVGVPLLMTVLDVVVVVAVDEALAVALPLELAGALLLVVPVAGVLAAELPGEEEEDEDEEEDAEAAGDDDEDDGLGELAGAVAEGEAEPCGHDEIGVGSWCCAAVVCAPAAPPSVLPPPPLGAVLPDVLADPVPSRTEDTEEANAARNGGIEAVTTPMAKTAQASAMAGLISASRQPMFGRAVRCACPGRSVPPRRAFQRRTASARNPEIPSALACLLA